jgi:hypothetical protein
MARFFRGKGKAMDVRFLPHNTHWEDPSSFQERDPHLRQLAQQPLKYRSGLLGRFPTSQPGIYTLTGGRQVGKTTFLKQWMADLLHRRIPPRRIAFLTGEPVDDHHSLVALVGDVLSEMPGKGLRYLILDEVTYIREWDRGVKYLADTGILENVVFILTGSDMVIIQEARMRFPGRRGRAGDVDFHMYPLSFFEAVALKKTCNPEEVSALVDPEGKPPLRLVEKLFAEFEDYLVHGGFLTAMNDMARNSRIAASTFSTYGDWIRGDVLKRGKQEHYLREVLQAIVSHHGGSVTWNNLSSELSIDHPKTVADYAALLESMDAVVVQAALLEDKLAGAPKKPRKLMFADPFVFHAVRSWLKPSNDPYEHLVLPALRDPETISRLAESCAVTHYKRHFPTYYIKAKGEVDIAYVEGRKFWPIEVKWTGQLRPKDLRQVTGYRNGRILDRSRQSREIQGIWTEPLPLALLRLDAKR